MGFQHKKTLMRVRRYPRWIRRSAYKRLLAETFWRRSIAQGQPKRMNYTSIVEWLRAQGL